MDSRKSAEKEERAQPKSLLERFTGHPFKCDIKTYGEVKDIIQKKSVRARLLFTVGAGLPLSGTSTLLRGILNCSDIEFPPSQRLGVYSTALFIDSVKKDGHVIVFDQKNEEHGMLLIALTKQLMTKQFNVHSPLEDSGQLFQDSDVNKYFKNFCDKLLAFRKDLMKQSDSVVAIMKSQCFINFLDITVNKAIYECLFIVGSWCKNGFLLSVLDLYHYSCGALRKPLDLSDTHFKGKCYRKEDISLLKVHSACNFFVSIFEGTFAKQKNENRALLVCTHKDKLTEEEVQKRIDELLVEIGEYAKDMKISSASVSDILAISNTEGSGDHKRVLQKLVTLIEKCLKYSDDIQLKHMFFYSYLKSSGEMFLTREAVNVLGSKCEMDKGEVSKCLQLLHDSCFLFRINDFVILKLSDFIDDINKLYYIQNDKKAAHMLSEIEFGFLSKNLCHYIWGQHPPRLCGFYISVLMRVGLMIELQNHSQEFFMPSLRTEHKQKNVNASSTSLLVLFDTTSIPFHKQCLFVKYFQKNGAEVLSSSFYNVLKLQLQDYVIVTILFCKMFLEISIKFTNSELPKHTRDGAYSTAKSTCARVLNRMRSKGVQERDDILDFRYHFAVCCPNSAPQQCHYIIFQDSCQPENIWCNTCKANIDEKTMPERSLWMMSACEDCALHNDDILNPANLLAISERLKSPNLSSNLDLGGLYKVFDDYNNKRKKETSTSAEGLSAESEPCKNTENQLFHAFYTWHCYNKPASRISLAMFTYKAGYEKEAMEMEPFLTKWLGTKERNILLSSKVLQSIADWWPSSSDDLATILKVEPLKDTDSTCTDQTTCVALLKQWSEENNDGDQLKNISELLAKHEYFIPDTLF